MINPYMFQSLIDKLKPKQYEEDPYNIDPSLYKPGPAFEEYSRFLATQPHREDYKLGTGKNILAILAGALTGASSGNPSIGIGVTEKLRDKPYRTAMEEYDNRAQGLGKVAALEEKNQDTQRKYRNDAMDAFTARERNKTAQSEAESRSQARLDQLAVLQQNAKTNEEKLKWQKERDKEQLKYEAIRARATASNAESAKINAGANKTRADAYVKDLDFKHTHPKEPPAKLNQVVNDIIGQYPDLADTVYKNASGAFAGFKVTSADDPKATGEPITDPNQLAKVAKMRKLINERLGLSNYMDTDLEDVEPIVPSDNDDNLQFIPD